MLKLKDNEYLHKYGKTVNGLLKEHKIYLIYWFFLSKPKLCLLSLRISNKSEKATKCQKQ